MRVERGDSPKENQDVFSEDWGIDINRKKQQQQQMAVSTAWASEQ